MSARIASAPPFRHPAPDPAALDELAAAYLAITGSPIRSRAQRNLLAACARVHGPAVLDVIRARFAATGVNNCLGLVRTSLSVPVAGEEQRSVGRDRDDGIFR